MDDDPTLKQYWFNDLPGRWLSCSVSEIAGSNLTLAFRFQRNEKFIPPLTRKDKILCGASVTER